MIPALFLISALAGPAIFAGNIGPRYGPNIPTHKDLSIVRMLAAFWRRDAYDDLKDTTHSDDREPHLLIMSDTPGIADKMRAARLKAWQFSALPAISHWQIQGDIWRSPIKPHSIHLLWAHYPVSKVAEIIELMWMIRDWGFLIVNLPEGGWGLLRAAGFTLFPHRWRDYEIWRRSS